MNWRDVWFPGIYEANDVVKDGDWTMVANKQTTDNAAPQKIGDPFYYYTDNRLFLVIDILGINLAGLQVGE